MLDSSSFVDCLLAGNPQGDPSFLSVATCVQRVRKSQKDPHSPPFFQPDHHCIRSSRNDLSYLNSLSSFSNPEQQSISTMPRSSHGQSSRPPSSQRSSGRSRKSTRPPHSRDSSTILPSTIQPTTFPSTMSEPASTSRLQFKQYTPSCNAFEHMNTLKETVDYWTDATKSHLTANQAKRQRDLASIVNTYAQTAGTATDVKQDLAKTTHTALKGMYWVYKNAAESGTGESKRVLTDACKEINSLFGQSEVKE